MNYDSTLLFTLTFPVIGGEKEGRVVETVFLFSTGLKSIKMEEDKNDYYFKTILTRKT